MSKTRAVQGWVWIGLLIVAIAMPWVFYNYHTGRQSGFVVSMLSQMGMMTILALSYNMLLGQAGLFSLLAGFVEAGESFETCVVREIREEIGLTVRDIRYLGSQPWPFPRSLMIGFHAIGDPDEPFSFNDGEIAEAEWFTRDEVRAALAIGDWSSDSESKLLLPGSVSIARVIIESWAEAGDLA